MKQSREFPINMLFGLAKFEEHYYFFFKTIYANLIRMLFSFELFIS